MMSQSAQHLTGMITALLDYSKKSVAEQATEETDVAELVMTVSYFLYPPPNITVEVVSDMPVLFTRRLKLMQVFQNLIGNAIKYNDKPKGLIEVGCIPHDNHYEFFVRDNGPGIAKKDEKKIFNLFEITDNVAKNESSTGVGLNIMKMLVEEQGGRFRVESEEGKSSCFYFEWRK
jgi:signal transduction histidine kinase